MQSWHSSGNQSRYFVNGIGDHPTSQNRSRLSPLPPHPSRSPGAVASSKAPWAPLHSRQQPHPFFASGPAATGYVPQQCVKRYRKSGPQQPIIPLREEFSNRSMALQGLEQVRPYSVPSYYIQTSQPKFENSGREIPRPASVSPASTQTPLNFNHHIVRPPREGGELELSPPKRGVPEDQCFEDDFIPAKRTLPFPTKKQAKAQTVHSEAQRETVVTKSPSLKVVSIAGQQVNQCTTDEPNLSRKAAEKVKASTSLSQPLNKRENGKEKMTRKHLDDAPDNASVDNLRASKRLKIKFTNWHASRQGRNTFTAPPTSAHMNAGASQGFQPSQMSWENSQGGSISGGLDSVTGSVAADVTSAALPRVRNLSHTHPAKVDRDMEREKTLVLHSSTPEDSHSTTIRPSLSSYHDRSSNSEASPQLSLGTAPICGELSRVHAGTSTCKMAKRSASQATTVSATSTEPSLCTAGNGDAPKAKDSFNQMSMIDETMILQRDISDIVNARLQQGTASLLNALHGEILIKMAVWDNEMCEQISRILKS
ncbi:hypothetical protein F4824DRAFT_470214 [Ustulina deusta]|nr:hypothetical protein F4824DRAFT_470214 [Ustulina deusta]